MLQSTQSLIVVDDIESLIDFVAVGPRFNAAVLTTLFSKLRTPPPEGRSRVIIATTNKYTVMSQLDVLGIFDRLINVDIVRGPKELFKLLESIRSDDAPKAIVSRLLESYDARDVNIGVKHVLSATMVPDGAPDVVDYCVEGIIQHLKPLPREEDPRNIEQ
jgi:vesicle-fusing ATPase